MAKINLVVLYQVIMHYRIPLYEKLELDPNIYSEVFYGSDVKGTKLVSTNLDDSIIKRKKHLTIRFPFRTNNGSGSLPFSPFLILSLIFKSPDVILSEGTSSIINSSIAFLYAKIFNKKFIWWSLGKLEGREYKGFRGLISRWENYIAQSSNAIFTYSNLGKQHFINVGVDSKKIFVGVNVLDTNKKLNEISTFRNKVHTSQVDDSKFNISFIGSIIKEKNLETLIAAVKKFNNKYFEEAVLHIIGDGSYLNQIKEILLKDNHQVVLHGRINEGASTILGKCDLMVLPGLGGLAICEAMLNSLPIITGKADGTEYDLIGNENGFILPEITIDSIFIKLEYLYLNPIKRKKMGVESYKKITTELHFDNYYQKLIEAINYTQLKS